ncbi:chorismate-binding protein [Candidatus Vidania fulgoroideae]|uniref:Chorismate-binding protein n=1 Tax=Candidatus Vidania fulgoroideorum TaxID=881286 RepID=A0A975ADX8_9PROT|nr:chorismate-binding protein [Candidatus Vidania fulgoroideae]
MNMLFKENGGLAFFLGNYNIYNAFNSLKRKLNNRKYSSFLFKSKNSAVIRSNIEIMSFSKKSKYKNSMLKVYDYIYHEKLKNIKRKGNIENIGDYILIFNNRNRTFVSIKEEKKLKGKIRMLKILYQVLSTKLAKTRKFFYSISKSKNKKKYIYKYNIIKNYIRKGIVIQCQIGKENIIRSNMESLRLLKLCKRNDIGSNIYISYLRELIICFTPEVLVTIENSYAYMYPIAGTIKRGISLILDKIYERKMLNDKKELSEHIMLIDIARNDLNSISKINTVVVKKKFLIRKFFYVQHIVSEIKSHIKKVNQKKVLKRISPSGTLTGSPKIKSMEIIKELENNRGNYGGCIGFDSIKKHIGMFFVTIRAAFKKGNYLIIKSASGIVNKSKIKMEYRELNNKMKVFLKK